VRIRIEARDLPGRDSGRHRNVHVGVQRRGRNEDILDPVRADQPSATWEFEATTEVKAGDIDMRGPYVNGGLGARFVYLSWGTFENDGFVMFGRSKFLLAEVGNEILTAAVDSGTLVGRVGLVDESGRLRMAAIKPPAITWTAE
jgi:hypothetical protein